jgi:hypothetical protein
MEELAKDVLWRVINEITEEQRVTAATPSYCFAYLEDLRRIHRKLEREERRDDAGEVQGPTPAAPVESESYAKLGHVLKQAYDQAATGKGKDRHVKHEAQAFQDQPICTLQRIYGSGYAFGQVGKKMEESMRMDTKAAVAELYGAINYIAAAIIVLEEGE